MRLENKIDRRLFLRAMAAGTLAAAVVSLEKPGDIPSISSLFAQSSQLKLKRAVNITVDPNNQIGTNNLSLGFMLDQDDWKAFVNNSVRKELARDANFRLIRLFDYKEGCPRPCTLWDETTRTGTFDWTNIDLVVREILGIGAEPLFCLGGHDSTRPLIPSGMAVDPSTGLPHPESFAAYASEWVKHFRTVGLGVRYYEIVNEPWGYFGRQPDLTKLGNYMRLFNQTATSMRQQDSAISISFDWIAKKPVQKYWLENGGADVDTLNFHKYDGHTVGDPVDDQMLALAESQYFGTWPLEQTIGEARQFWFNSRGKVLPIILSESNFNSACSSEGTDIRIQQMVGAVWTALVLRMSILNGVHYSIYYKLMSSASYATSKPSGGAGFGMINSDNNRPWYPYYVHHMIGRNLAPGDPLVSSSSSSDDIRSLAWIHSGTLNVFLICRSPQQSTKTAYIQGVRGSQFSFFKIDDTIPWQTPQMQTGVTGAEGVDCTGYAVALLQTPLSA